MKRLRIFILVLMLIMTGSIAGCAFMQKMLPSQIDAQGNIIPGTHTANATEQAAAGMLPYGIGNIALYLILLGWNGWEKFKAAKANTGLTATIKAINQIKDDPALVADWEKIKQILSNAHTVANVQPLIQQFLAKMKIG